MLQFFCDNEAVMHMVNKFASSCPQCMKLIRVLALQGIRFNRCIKVKYVHSRDNVLSDALSRLDFPRFWKHAPATVHSEPNPISSKLWPIEKFGQTTSTAGMHSYWKFMLLFQERKHQVNCQLLHRLSLREKWKISWNSSNKCTTEI